MRKSDIIHEIVNTTHISPRDADNVLAATLEYITNALARNETVQLSGLEREENRLQALREPVFRRLH